MFKRIGQAVSSLIELLEPRRLLSVGPQSGPRDIVVAAGDLDGDGRADMAIIHRDLATRNVLLTTYHNDGGGKFSRRGSVDMTREEFAAMSIGDLDGDGLPDIAILANSLPGAAYADPKKLSRVIVLKGDGKGGLARGADGSPIMSSVFLPDNTVGDCITVADLDGDGAADIAVVDHAREAGTGLATGRTTSVDILWGAPKGTPPAREFIVQYRESDLNFDIILSGDVDGDGRPDIVAGESQSNIVTEILQRLRPHPNIVTIVGLASRKGLATAQQNPLYKDNGLSGTNPLFESKRLAGLGDLDGDGKAELIAMSYTRKGGAVIACDFDYKASRWMAPESISSDGAVPPFSTNETIADLNGDKIPDIVTYNALSDVWSFGITVRRPDGPKLVWSPKSNFL